jgi:hypothetical protein
MSEFSQAAIPDGKHEINGNVYMGDGKGGSQPVETIKPQHLIEDETVRKILGYGIALSDQMARFKEHTFDDIGSHEAILEQEFNTKVGGAKGNKTLQTVDGLFKVQVQVSDYIAFGPELQIAKALFDECLNEWAADARAELRALVTNAFQTDKTGNINRSRIFMLLRQDSEDPRWQEGQRAIREAMRVVGSKTYVRCYQRASHDARWEPVVLDMAAV